jgi:AcrR family transcriptional regulator
MQFLKDEVRNAIVAAALSEFMEKGYGGASMRAIAKASGITAGNIYRYFVTKDSLFNAIMDPVSREMMDLVYADKYVEGMPGKVLDIDAIMQSIMRLCRLHATEMHILLFKSEGSSFEDVRRKLAEMIARRVTESAAASGSEMGSMIAKEPMAQAVSAAFVEGVSEVFKQSKGNIEALEENIRMLILFFFRDIYKGFVK